MVCMGKASETKGYVQMMTRETKIDRLVWKHSYGELVGDKIQIDYDLWRRLHLRYYIVECFIIAVIFLMPIVTSLIVVFRIKFPFILFMVYIAVFGSLAGLYIFEIIRMVNRFRILKTKDDKILSVLFLTHRKICKQYNRTYFMGKRK